MPRYFYGKSLTFGDRRLLDIVPDGYETKITDKMIMDIWNSHYQDIEIKTEKDPKPLIPGLEKLILTRKKMEKTKKSSRSHTPEGAPIRLMCMSAKRYSCAVVCLT